MASFPSQIRGRVPNYTQQQLGDTIEAQNVPVGRDSQGPLSPTAISTQNYPKFKSHV